MTCRFGLLRPPRVEGVSDAARHQRVQSVLAQAAGLDRVRVLVQSTRTGIIIRPSRPRVLRADVQGRDFGRIVHPLVEVVRELI